MKAALSIVGIVWALACWAGFVYCLVIGELGLAFGLAFASLVPVILDPAGDE
jgi:hypothetical protein